MTEMPRSFTDEDRQWWLDNGFHCLTAERWRDAGFDPETARILRKAGIDINEAPEWMDATYDTLMDAVDIAAIKVAGMSPNDVPGGPILGYDPVNGWLR